MFYFIRSILSEREKRCWGLLIGKSVLEALLFWYTRNIFCILSFINVWYVEFVVAVILILQLIFSLIVNAGLGRLPDSPCSGLVPPRRR